MCGKVVRLDFDNVNIRLNCVSEVIFIQKAISQWKELFVACRVGLDDLTTELLNFLIMSG